jgi:hypothetical protein
MSDDNEKPEEAKREVPQQNQAIIRDGVCTVTLHLERSDSAFAESVGSLELAKDLIKNYFMQKQMREAVLRKTNGLIIKPGLAN